MDYMRKRNNVNIQPNRYLKLFCFDVLIASHLVSRNQASDFITALLQHDFIVSFPNMFLGVFVWFSKGM